jgi:hypothetical protein
MHVRHALQSASSSSTAEQTRLAALEGRQLEEDVVGGQLQGVVLEEVKLQRLWRLERPARALLVICTVDSGWVTSGTLRCWQSYRCRAGHSDTALHSGARTSSTSKHMNSLQAQSKS